MDLKSRTGPLSPCPPFLLPLRPPSLPHAHSGASCSLGCDRDAARPQEAIHLRQLSGIDVDDVIIRARWPGKGLPTQAKLSEIQADTKSLESGRPGAIPLSFEVIMIRDIAGRFSGRQTFIEELEKLIPEFYERIGQRLRSWSPPPPSIVKRDPIEKPTTDEKSGVRHEDVISHSETKQSGEPQETEVVNMSSSGDP